MRNLWVIKPKPDEEVVSLLEKEVTLPRALAITLAQRGIVNFELAKEFLDPICLNFMIHTSWSICIWL